jgi:hypothetical protein
MKHKTSLCLLVALVSVSSVLAQGKFAGSYRSLLNKSYPDKSQLPLPGFTFQGGSFMGDLYLSWYRKGNLAVALFEGISKTGYRVYDVLQLSNFSDTQSIRFANCLNARAIDDEGIVAVVTATNTALLKATSAWRWNDEHKALESIDSNEANGISCPQQPEYSSLLTAPDWKPFLHQVYKDTKEIPALKEYTLSEGTLLPGNTVSVSSYTKPGYMVLVFERIVQDNYRFVFEIIETPITKNQDIRVGLCRRGTLDDGAILAVVQRSDKERWQAVKAWVCDGYHLTVTELPAKDITCLGNYGEN